MPPLLKRASATFKKNFPEIIVYGSTFKMPSRWVTFDRINRLLGEIDRLNEYAKKGDIVKVEIPDDIISAIEEIRRYLKNSQ